jgi:hypothetical protein
MKPAKTWETIVIPFKIKDRVGDAVLISITNTDFEFCHPCSLTKIIDKQVNIRYSNLWKFYLICKESRNQYRVTIEKIKYIMALGEDVDNIAIMDMIVNDLKDGNTKIIEKYKPTIERTDFPCEWKKKANMYKRRAK